MKHKDYKLLFMSVLNKKTWQIEFTRSTLITGSIIVGLCFIISLSLLVLSIPIVREYLEINAINRKINTQKEAIDDLSDSLNEIGLMKSYIENIIGLDSEDKLNSSNIRFMVTGNIPNIKPNNGIMSKEFDLESNHFGIDIVNEEDSPILSTANGIVIYSDFSVNYGNSIIIDHENGYYSHYYHNEENFVKRNERIEKNTIIAYLGNTGMSSGPHLHFEIWKDGKPINPLSFFPDYSKKSDKLETESNEQ